MSDWFRESLYDHWSQSFLISRELYRSQGGMQDIALFETPGFGRVLTLDGIIQVTTGDEFIYHEMLAHVPIYAHGAVRSVCVVGGGDGGMLREVLKHRSVEHAVLVEIDAAVVDFCRRHMPTVSAGAFDDPRCEIVIADGLKFMAETDRKFDLIVIDSTDPIGPGGVLFTEEFYQDCARCLTAEGIVVNQNGVPFLQGEEITDTWRRRRPHFADVGFYVAAVPTYVGGFMALGWASHSTRPRTEGLDQIHARFAAAPVTTRYYTPDLHRAAFALPRYIQDLIPG
ncbi:spermidine synthase (putrescine aminopropyltransferase) [Magnetospirillum sp. LM-5]|uniref:polyamine aminopropyltransferase n=1 Tax=Magnetospirillum sp. LM-5 TaxID=2681466 RepID=UPI00137D797B|nr:polyamine aminopropyltransferase [Magnetospirillum sp. LM-5]CAA7624151.1 spermidine synthase (putrescine aminopropyltransferase) [Magnetospirillum sp. LM-5]